MEKTNQQQGTALTATPKQGAENPTAAAAGENRELSVAEATALGLDTSAVTAAETIPVTFYDFTKKGGRK